MDLRPRSEADLRPLRPGQSGTDRGFRTHGGTGHQGQATQATWLTGHGPWGTQGRPYCELGAQLPPALVAPAAPTASLLPGPGPQAARHSCPLSAQARPGGTSQASRPLFSKRLLPIITDSRKQALGTCQGQIPAPPHGHTAAHPVPLSSCKWGHSHLPHRTGPIG